MALSVPTVGDQRVQQALNAIATSFPLTTQLLVDEVITTTKLVEGSVTAEKVAAEAIQAGHIETGTITATQVKTGSLTTDTLAANAVTTAKLASGAVTTDILAAGAATIDKLDIDELSGISANLGTITTGTLTGATVQTSASNPRVIMDAEGLRRLDAEGTPDFTLDSEGLQITDGTITGATFQTAAAGARVEIDSAGIRGINAAAAEQFNFDTASGILTATAVISSLTGSAIDTEHLAGQIAETQIENDAISTPKLQANIIKGKHLAVETLGALKADLGTITAGTLTGVTFQTSASNPRVYFDAEGFHATDAEGGLVVDIPSDGSTAGFAGQFQVDGLTLPEEVGLTSDNAIEWRAVSGDRTGRLVEWGSSGSKVATINLDANPDGKREAAAVQLRAFNASVAGPSFSLLSSASAKSVSGSAGPAGTSFMLMDDEAQSDFLQLPSTAKAVHLWGYVDSNGNKVSGSNGWTVEKTATGTYKVAFSPKLSGTPAVTFVSREAGKVAYRLSLATDEEAVLLMSPNTSIGSLSNGAFHFNVTG